MNANVYFTKDYENEIAFRLQKNKPNSNPISSKAKMNLKSLAGKSGHTQMDAIVTCKYLPGVLKSIISCCVANSPSVKGL